MPVSQSDVVIIGSGVAGALMAAELAGRGVRVCILEAGAPVDRTQAVHNFWQAPVKVPESAYPPVPHAMHPTSDKLDDWYCQVGPDRFKSTYLKVVGGTTWHWLGTCLRLLPSDFRTFSEHGYGTDWPISYDEIEPAYVRAEHALAVAGDVKHELGSPRSAPYPLPPIPQSYLDTTLTQALHGTRFIVSPTPQARNSVAHDQRPPCCGSSSCIPVCPIQAKYDATVHLKKAIGAGAHLLDGCTVVRLEADDTGQIVRAHYRRRDQSTGDVQGRYIVLACHAIETPRLLLASRNNAWPQGLANTSGMVGRHLMDHPVQLSWALASQPVYPYRGPLSTSGIENLREGAFRRQRSAYRIEIGNDGWSWPTGAPASTAAALALAGIAGADLDAAIADETSRHLRLAALTEQLPDPDNRVALDPHKADVHGVPLPHITYRVDDYARQGMAHARRDHDEIFRQMGASRMQHATNFFGAGHIMGTCRMGEDPRRSVVDPSLFSHDHKNMVIVGSSVFPTGGTANPTLTIAALSLRAADAIADRLAGSGPG
ncbi:MAG TPA: GMC family oxidoreductase [Burkholderiaceae bacterium]|nr:GMC family oxidoreductase [Burkholderiaceae bacterium]